MKVTDGCNSSSNGNSKKKLLDQSSERKVPDLEPCDTENGNGHHGAMSEDTNSSSGSEDSETQDCAITNNDSTHNGNSEDATEVRNGLSDKENSNPSKSKSKKSKGSSNKSLKNTRNSEERNGVNTAKSANNEETPEESVDGSEEAAANAEGKPDSAEDVYYVHDTGLTIKIVSPGSEPFDIQVRGIQSRTSSYFPSAHSKPVSPRVFRSQAVRLYRSFINCSWNGKTPVIELVSHCNLMGILWTTLQSSRVFLDLRMDPS